jgi:hypothetical protein
MIARTSSSAWVRGVVEMFAAEGIDVEALFRDARLDIATLQDPAAASRSTTSARCGKWRWRAPASDSRAVARACPHLRQARRRRPRDDGVPDPARALQQLARSMDVVSNAATFALTPDADGHWFELGHLGGERPVPRQRVEFGC